MKTNENNIVYLPRGKGKTKALLDHAIAMAKNCNYANILFVTINMDTLEYAKEYIKEQCKDVKVAPLNANIIFENGSRILFHTRYSIEKGTRGVTFTDIIVDDFETIQKQTLDLFLKNVNPVSFRTMTFATAATEARNLLDCVSYLIGKSFHVYNDYTKLSKDNNYGT